MTPPKYVTRVFESLDALAAFAADAYCRQRADDAWAGGTLAECIHKTREGDLALVAESDTLLKKFESLTFPTQRREWRSDVAGFAPNVPAFIAGHHASMRRRVKRFHEVAPVTVFCDVFASASFTHQEILTRGAAVLALTRILAGVRAVSLYVAFASTNSRSGCVAAKVDTAPLDLAHASYALCGVGFLRRVMFSALEGTFRSWPFPMLQDPIGAVAAEMLPQGTNIIGVGGMRSDIVRDPARWIEGRIREAAPEVLGEAA